MANSKPQLLWSLTHPHFPGNAYLFGTMHVRDLRAFRYQELVQQKIMECDAFATEINLREANHTLTDRNMNLPDGQSLDQLLSAKQYRKVAKYFKQQTGMPLEPFNQSSPMLITNLLTEQILSADQPHSLDEHFFRFAESQDKITLGIETLEEQLNIMTQIPLDHQVKSLVDMARDPGKFRRQLLRITEIYESGDLRRILKSAKKSSGALRKILLYQRNEIMAERIFQLATEQSICCAVGAGHLGGKKGILKLMKEMGVKVRNVGLGG